MALINWKTFAIEFQQAVLKRIRREKKDKTFIFAAQRVPRLK